MLNLRNNSVEYCFIFFIILALYFPLGLNYTPTSDGWVGLSNSLPNLSTSSTGFFTFENLIGNPKQDFSRFFRRIPYVLHANFFLEGFYVIKSLLVAIYFGVAIGVFLILKYWFPIWTALLCTVIFVAFPFDHSIYQLGFWGVNISLLSNIWSLFFLHRFHQTRQSVDLFAALLLLIICNFSYPGPFLVAPTLVIFFFIKNFNNMKKNLRIYLIFVFFIVMGVCNILLHMIAPGRNSKVANFDIINVVSGYGHMVKTLFWEAPKNIFIIDNNQLLLALGCGIISGLMIAYSRRLKNDKNIFQFCKASKRSKLFLLAVATVLIFVGYFPFSISEVRFDLDRPLLFARYGLILIIGFILVWLKSKLRKFKSSYIKHAFVFILIFGLTALFTEKFKIADRYKEYSQEQVFFLAGISRILSKTDIDRPIFLYVDDRNTEQIYHPMVINRPEYLLAYLYDIRVNNFKVVSTNAWMLSARKVIFDKEQSALVGYNKKISKKHMIGIRYVPGKIVELLPSIEIKVSASKNSESIHLAFDNPVNNDWSLKTNRADYFRINSQKKL